MFYIPDSIVAIRKWIKKQEIKSGYLFPEFYKSYDKPNKPSTRFGIFLQWVIQYLIPKVPEHVRIKKAKIQYLKAHKEKLN